MAIRDRHDSPDDPQRRTVAAGQNAPPGGAPDPTASPPSQQGQTGAQTSAGESALGLGGPLAPTEDAVRPLPGVVPEDEASRLFYEMRALGIDLVDNGQGGVRFTEPPGGVTVPPQLRERLERHKEALRKAWGGEAADQERKAQEAQQRERDREARERDRGR